MQLAYISINIIIASVIKIEHYLMFLSIKFTIVPRLLSLDFIISPPMLWLLSVVGGSITGPDMRSVSTLFRQVVPTSLCSIPEAIISIVFPLAKLSCAGHCLRLSSLILLNKDMLVFGVATETCAPSVL